MPDPPNTPDPMAPPAQDDVRTALNALLALALTERKEAIESAKKEAAAGAGSKGITTIVVALVGAVATLASAYTAIISAATASRAEERASNSEARASNLQDRLDSKQQEFDRRQVELNHQGRLSNENARIGNLYHYRPDAGNCRTIPQDETGVWNRYCDCLHGAGGGGCEGRDLRLRSDDDRMRCLNELRLCDGVDAGAPDQPIPARSPTR